MDDSASISLFRASRKRENQNWYNCMAKATISAMHVQTIAVDIVGRYPLPQLNRCEQFICVEVIRAENRCFSENDFPQKRFRAYRKLSEFLADGIVCDNRHTIICLRLGTYENNNDYRGLVGEQHRMKTWVCCRYRVWFKRLWLVSTMWPRVGSSPTCFRLRGVY